MKSNIIIAVGACLLFAGCQYQSQHSSILPEVSGQGQPPSSPSSPPLPDHSLSPSPSFETVTDPDSILVLVNKQHVLPEGYRPKDLVYPDVAFLFKEKIEKREMRKEAADALVKLFAGAQKDGIFLAGVSAFRSFGTQQAVFNQYVQQDGETNAITYSARPGTSEHQTGLAIDLSGRDGKCAATDCFADTPEARWIAQHVSDYGFILRYPKGKESITGYQYEPWHIRYVGLDVSREIYAKGLTFEEYLEGKGTPPAKK